MFFWPGDALYEGIWDIAESCIDALYFECVIGFEGFGVAAWFLLVVWEAMMY
jgi:hypothetical protein